MLKSRVVGIPRSRLHTGRVWGFIVFAFVFAHVAAIIMGEIIEFAPRFVRYERFFTVCRVVKTIRVGSNGGVGVCIHVLIAPYLKLP
jgi:hypothetical protein